MKEIFPGNNKELRGEPAEATHEAMQSPTLNPEGYREYLEDFDLDEAEQNELLIVLWNIMRSFVEMGFGLNSVQMLLPAIAENSGKSVSDSVKQISRGERFNRLANLRKEVASKEEVSDE